MSKAPLMPMATAVWLVENTTLTFKQIADYCKLHEVEVQGIADGEVAKGIVGYNPIMSDQLTREEIKLSSEDNNVEQALRVLKRKLQRDGFFKIIKLKNTYEKPSEKKKRILQENIKRVKKLNKLKNRI